MSDIRTSGEMDVEPGPKADTDNQHLAKFWAAVFGAKGPEVEISIFCGRLVCFAGLPN